MAFTATVNELGEEARNLITNGDHPKQLQAWIEDEIENPRWVIDIESTIRKYGKLIDDSYDAGFHNEDQNDALFKHLQDLHEKIISVRNFKIQ